VSHDGEEFLSIVLLNKYVGLKEVSVSCSELNVVFVMFSMRLNEVKESTFSRQSLYFSGNTSESWATLTVKGKSG